MDLFTAKKLTALRKYYSLSQEALAEKVGVSRQAISKWERGEASPDTDNLLMLSKIYSVSLDDLLGEKTAEEIIAELEKEKEECPDTEETEEIIPPEKETPPEFYSDRKEEEKTENKTSYYEIGKKLLKLPYFLIALIVFLVIGFSANKWHPTWMLFLTIPTYYLTAWAFTAKTNKKMFLRLPVYLYVIILYLLMGFTASLWHPMWILFLFIPAYYWFIGMGKTNKS